MRTCTRIYTCFIYTASVHVYVNDYDSHSKPILVRPEEEEGPGPHPRKSRFRPGGTGFGFAQLRLGFGAAWLGRHAKPTPAEPSLTEAEPRLRKKS